MKARKNTLKILFAVFALSLVTGIAAGCTVGDKNSKERAEERGMTASVTYYTNGGNFVTGTDSADYKVYRTDYYKPDTPIFNIGFDKTTGQSLSIVKDGYLFAGWEYALLDEEGLPYLYAPDENGNPIGDRLRVLENGTASIKDDLGKERMEQEKRFVAKSSGEKVFEKGHPILADGEHKYLVATWEKDVVLEYRLITDAPIQVNVGEETVTYNNGDVIKEEGFLTSTELMLTPQTVPATFPDFSYISLYWDEEGEEAVIAGEKVYKSEDKTNSVIYAKYLSGSWTPVRDASSAAIMMGATDKRNFFVVYDIDCSGGSFTYKQTGTFGGVIEGNGKTLSNITISGQTIQNPVSCSLFGSLSATAEIKNLTLKNINISFSLNGTTSAYLLFSAVAEGAKIENFAVMGATLRIRLSDRAILNNIQLLEGGYEVDNWLYGAYDTDEKFENEYGKFVQNCTLIINEEEIVSGGHYE